MYDSITNPQLKYQVYIWKNRPWSSFSIKWVLFHDCGNRYLNFSRNDVYIWIKHKCVPCVFGKIPMNEKQLKSFNIEMTKKIENVISLLVVSTMNLFSTSHLLVLLILQLFLFFTSSILQGKYIFILFYLNNHFHKFMSSRNGKIVFYTTIMYAIVKHFLLILLYESKSNSNSL